MQRTVSVIVLLYAIACSSNKSGDNKAPKDAGVTRPTVAPIAMPQTGIDSIKRINFIYAEGARDHAKAMAAYNAKSRDWGTVRASDEAALGKDPNHLDAHYYLGTALAAMGEHAAAVDHFVQALAADYLKYGPLLEKDPDLKTFFTTPHGTAVTELIAKIKAEYGKRIASGVLLVARRSTFKYDPKPGVQSGSTRGELYAYDRETRRFYRLTHTDHQVAGFVRAPAGNEIAVLGFDKIDHPKEDSAPPLVTRSWVQVLDTTEWQPVGPKATSTTTARELMVGYGAGDQLLVAAAPANGRFGTGEPTVSSLDRTTGKLAKVAPTLPSPRIVFSLEEGRVVRVPGDVKAAWAGDPPTAPTLDVTGKPIAVPLSGAAAQATVSVAPDKARIAFATAADPCAKDAAPSLYVADAKTGVLKHVLTAKSRFTTRWIDATTLAYEDGDGAIRLWNAQTGREDQKIDNKPGLALDVLSLAPAPLCRQAPPTVEPAGPGEEPPLPPEEPAGSGSGAKP